MKTRSKRVIFGGLVHETHSFLETTTCWNNFRVYGGEEILQLHSDASPTGGFLTVANRLSWQVLPTTLAIAEPSGIITERAFETFWNRFESDAQTFLDSGVDAIFLVIHGAGSCETFPDMEGELLRRIRTLNGAANLPIFGVMDLHANFSHAMAQYSDCLISYRENPHVDARQSAMRATEKLNECLDRGIRPRQYVRQAPIIWPPTGTGTAAQPMRGLLNLARHLEKQHPDFIEISVNAGFAFCDGVHVGVSFSLATYSEQQTAESALNLLEQFAIANAAAGNLVDEAIDSVFKRLDRWRAEGDLTGLNILVEPSDNVGGGGPGGGVTLLRRLLKEQFDNIGFCVCDSMAIETLRDKKIGDSVYLSLGGKGSRLYDPPLELDCVLLHLGEGHFPLEDSHSHLAAQWGSFFDMGTCAIVKHGTCTVLITSNATPPMDLGQWRHFGINPEDFNIMVVKAAVAHRQAYDPIARRQIWVDTPGPCSSNLLNFKYQALRRPVYPLDDLPVSKS